MKSRLLLSLSLCFYVTLAAQQNSNEAEPTYLPNPPHPEFFKYVPLVDTQTPTWAIAMYGENPNVPAVEQAYEAYYDEHDFEKSIHTQNYKHWRRNVYQNHYVQPSGFIRVTDHLEQQRNLDFHRNQLAQRNSQAGNWTALGPFETQAEASNTIVTWQSNIYTIDQSVSNPDIIYAGTETGGLFKSVDKGQSWFSIGDGLILGGIGSIKVDPNDFNTVYVGQGRYLYKSTNGGTSWTLMLDQGGLNIRDIHINPTNSSLVMLAAASGLYRSDDGAANFSQILTDGCYDIENKPDDPTVIYVAKANNSLQLTEVWKSTDSGLSFTAKTNGWFVPTNGSAASNGGARLAVTPADPDYLYCALLGSDVSYAQDNNWVGVYKSTDAGESWTLPAGEPGGPYNSTHWCLSSFHPTFAWGGNYDQGFYNLGLAVSATDPESFLIGCLNLFRTEDGGATYTQWGGYGGGPGWQHPDIQEIEINGNDVWVACDGGLNLYTTDWNALESRMSGINSAEYWGFDAGWNEDVLVGGRYHNGNGGYHENYPAGRFIRLGGAESPTGYVNPGNNRQVYHSDIGGNLLPTSISAVVENLTNLGVYPNQAVANENKSEIVSDPACYNHLYLGSENSLLKSEDGGVTFSVLRSFNSTGNLVTGIEIPRNAPQVIYAAQRLPGAATIWKSTDGGASWTDLSPSFAGAGGGGIFITVDHANEDNIWAALSNGGSNGNKVFQSTDGGTSWTNLTTTTLNGHWCEDIMMQSGTDGGVYLATNLGIFYRNNSQSDWQIFNNGAPAKMANMTLKPFYRDGKIRTATYNRGIWESPFFESSFMVVQPMVDKFHSDCARDIFYFEDYSILNHAGASWNWSFSPEPLSVSSTSARNPEVVFGQAGTYTATLTVTQGGISDSKSLIITVSEACDAETVPGNALVLSGGQSDYAVAEKLDLASNDFTVSAWVKRNGDQADWAGIFFQRGSDAIGLGVGNDNELRYHPGWGWNSGLVLPDNEWAHLALVVSPTQVKIYLNGIAATHNASYAPLSFDAATYLGADPNFNNRRFRGLIDEVAFYTRAMTETEVRELMHLTRSPLAEPELLTYYQFNETDGPVLDRSGIRHASLSGSAGRQTSTGPFGGGTSFTADVNSGGVYMFTGTELSMTFPTSGSYPAGDIVVSKINNAPDQPAGATPVPSDGYWIVNNFGANADFSEIESIQFSGLPELNGEPEDYMLYKRPSTADGNSWGNGIATATSLSATTLTFADPNVSSFSQFTIDLAPALAVDLLRFGVELLPQQEVDVFWTTQREVESSHFEIEWSTDGARFQTLGAVASQSSAEIETLHYNFRHPEPSRGLNYYRLKSVDRGDDFTYSDVATILLEAPAQEFVVYPNPLRGESNLQIRTSSDQTYQFSLFNTKGNRIFRTDLRGDAIIPLVELSSGFYFYKIELPGQLINGKLIVE